MTWLITNGNHAN